MNSIENKVKTILSFGCNLPFSEFYSHTNEDMFKIINPYTEYKQDKIVLSFVKDGFENALDLAIEEIDKAYRHFTGINNTFNPQTIKNKS